ncbi:Oligosaccharide translocation protein [Sparassis crispa]|uniref:Man(5)GlcNAc(2)-PP-dolichol translocation protein RFT1 n=1 Tax=Sparassis crispa TaxID=139825 RepID=A0A401GUK3_9APHY|nr:Oligosaccharide translocation protein [Sparassis crispa]GBE85863.1 Oligosaccharide translocation protein [Sparassis crispa]
MAQDFSLSVALASASTLVLLQFFSRIFTFLLNQALVRLVSPQAFGTAAIQFELLLSTILFLSREGVRGALLRATPSSDATPDKPADQHSEVLAANISLLPVLLGIPAAILITVFYTVTASVSTVSQPHFRLSVTIYVCAALLELLSEPLYIRAQNQLRFDVRAKAEGLAVALKSVVAFAVLIAASADWALVAFAMGQAVYGLTIYLSYLKTYRGYSLWPRKVTTVVHGNSKTMYFDPSLLHLARAMTGQSVIKHFLTEGDKFLVSRLSPLADQGGYAMASNYGSLVARIILQPIEETSRMFFSKTLAAKNKEALETASSMLFSLLLMFTHLFLMLVTFGPPYLQLAASLLLPPRYLDTSAPIILHTYIYYIPIMAYNGILEAFFASACSPADLHAQSRWMFVFSVGFVVAAVGFAKGLGMGDAGLVWANIANLLCRAVYAWLFVQRVFREENSAHLVSWRKAAPPAAVLAVFVMSAAITRWSEVRHSDLPVSVGAQIGHISVGVACLVGCLSTWWVI